ncbi:MAG: FHA domain-containing protein [Candidatus Saccharibacteria bacterium]
MSNFNQYSPTSLELAPQAFDLQSVNTRPGKLAVERLSAQDLSQNPLEIDITGLSLIDEQTGLAGIIDAGGVPIKIYVLKDDHGNVVPDWVMFTDAGFDDQEEASHDNVKLNIVSLTAEKGTVNFGRNESGAGRLGLNDSKVSRHHFSASISEGILRLGDLDSSNGTSVITSSEKFKNEQEYRLGRHLGRAATAEIVTTPTPEFSIGKINYQVESVIPTTGRGDMHVIVSRDKKGTTRRFMVYRSMSEGSLRSSQGYETLGKGENVRKRQMKGAELSDAMQYTQDTQLNPDFAAKLQESVKGAAGLPLGRDEDQIHDTEAAMKLFKDFESNCKVFSLPDVTLAKLLFRLPAGNLSRGALKEHLGGDSDQLANYVNDMNVALEQSGLVPDFSVEPTQSQVETHPILGSVIREIYIKSGIEWHMKRDQAGRVWIDRIRSVKNEATPYGTDKELLYSGILTSKPLEYKSQSNGLPAHLRQDRAGDYNDITPFLAKFAPIEWYRAQRLTK